VKRTDLPLLSALRFAMVGTILPWLAEKLALFAAIAQQVMTQQVIAQ